MKKFNEMTEQQMSQVNGGSAIAFAIGLFFYFGIPGLIGAIIDKATKGK